MMSLLVSKGNWPLVEAFKKSARENRLAVHIRIHWGEKVSIKTLLYNSKAIIYIEQPVTTTC